MWRGGAVLLMIIFHSIFIGRWMFGFPFNPLNWGWTVVARSASWSFLFVAGWSAWLSWERARSKLDERRSSFLKSTLQRVGVLALAALSITTSTLWLVPEAPVLWGIIHCLAAGLLSLRLCLPHITPSKIIFTSFTIWTIGVLLPFSNFPSSIWLVPFGLPPQNFTSLDYVPLFPTMSLIWLGAGLAPWITKISSSYGRSLNAPWTGRDGILWLGKNSLLVYLTHIPLIIIILKIITILNVNLL